MKKYKSMLLFFTFILLFPTIVFAHDHTSSCYGGVQHICNGDEKNGGSCYTQTTDGNGNTIYVKTCGKTSGRYYNSNGQYLSPQCNAIGISATATNPVQNGTTPDFKMNITFLDGHMETINATRTDWNKKKDYSSGGTITLFWNGLISDAKTIGELSTTIQFTSPKVETPTPTLAPTDTPTPSGIEQYENEEKLEELPEISVSDNTTTPIITEEATITLPPEETPIVTTEITPKITDDNNITESIAYENENQKEEENIEEVEEIEDIPQEPTSEDDLLNIQFSSFVPFIVAIIIVIIGFGFVIWYNIKKKKDNTSEESIDLNNYFDK